MRFQLWFDRLPGEVILLFWLSQIWQLPDHIEIASWWREHMTVVGNTQISWALLVVGVLLLFRPELVRLWRWTVGPKYFTGYAKPVSFNVTTTRPATGAAPPLSIWERIRRRIFGRHHPTPHVEEERVFTERTAGELFASVVDLTELEMKRFAEPHVGKWIRVQSVIQEMREDDLFLYVTLGLWTEPCPRLQFDKGIWGGGAFGNYEPRRHSRGVRQN